MNETTSYTIEEVAGLLKVSKLTVYDLIKKGMIPAYRVGRQMRVDEADLKQYKMNMRMAQPIAVAEEPKMMQEAEPDGRPNVMISGQDISMDLISKHLEKVIQETPLRKYKGSLNSLIDMYQGKCDIVSVHLYDAETGQYNTPYVKRILSGEPFCLINAVLRKAGLYVQKGNPKNIQGWEDLKRTDILIINREKGSGARVLLDEQLRLLGVNPADVKGYSDIATDHYAVASQVSSGQADAGIGAQHAAHMGNVDFIPLIDEQYDIVVLKKHEQLLKAVKEILNSEEYKANLSHLKGYETKLTGKVIAET
ncbi:MULTISPECIES: substrate-binding domain-containing protein [unclassified Bacillus (in: firmicutes)]|uniref:substrate-binding domain-containing protein n=1 Tax=unclassified Bacillus (in: firmicutes) TaxID=185979 RepID=UPI0022803028|nr:excisionase family DNA-binding protein [Bacillus sp. S20C3]MCY8288725.1 excisionase family DNA-binding protein [Bacillus sp. N13C7]MCY8636203.1 excisionase family DNA-binding protein [Bacillus sp. S17B2]MCY9142266.1 excisionase family DNA-binding protein [Bacillus sp. T9C1]